MEKQTLRTPALVDWFQTMSPNMFLGSWLQNSKLGSRRGAPHHPFAGSIHGLTGGLHDAADDTIWVAIGCWAAVLHVAPVLFLGIAGNTNRRTAVRNTVLELENAACLVLASKTLVVALAILCNVLRSHLAEGIADLDDVFVATGRPHVVGGEVGVAPSTVPITLLHWFRAEGAHNTVTFCHSQHDVAGHDHMVANLSSSARANLILPLPRHHLCIDAGNLDTRFQALREMLFCNWTTNRDSSSCTCVVRALWRRL
mmetsp:Transcript_97274/g.178261  ORF Transcript_97274/g.178261 Transcript_97274/m.178261 type:complete len:256 (-) Transcript_97274:553-1320(-)